MDRQTSIELASKLLHISVSDAESYCMKLSQTDAWYFSVPVMGGDSIIIGDEKNVLYANSSVSYDRHIAEYLKGTRTPLSTFE